MSTLLSKDWTSHSQGPPTAGHTTQHGADTALELQTKVCENFTIMERATTRASSWLKVPTRDAIKTLC